MAVMLTIASTSTVIGAGLPGCLLIALVIRRKRRFVAACMLLAATVMVSGCEAVTKDAISSQAGTQSYPVTVMATSGAISHQLVINVTLSR